MRSVQHVLLRHRRIEKGRIEAWESHSLRKMCVESELGGGLHELRLREIGVVQSGEKITIQVLR